MHRRIADSLAFASLLLVVGCGDVADEGGGATGGSDSGGSDSGGHEPSGWDGGRAGAILSSGTGGARADGTGGARTDGTGGAEPDGTGGNEMGATGGEPAGGFAGSDGGGSGGFSTGGFAGSDVGGWAGSDGGATGATPGDSLVGLAFDIHVPLGDNGYAWCTGDCEPATVLVTSTTETEMEIIWGATGRASRHSLTRAGSAWNLENPVTLGTEWTWEYAMCADSSTLQSAVFSFAAAAGEGATGLEIAGHQESKHCSDDYSTTSDSDVTLTGERDARLPAVVFAADPIEPTHGVSLDLDKPLDPSATGSLEPDDGGDPILLEPRTALDGYVVGFETAQVLPLGARYTTRIVGADFAGVGAPEGSTVAILDDFGVVTPDGFETGVGEGVHGAEVVQTYGVSAIDGQFMLHGAPGSAVLLHLQRTRDEQTLAFDARVLDECGYSWLTPGIGIRVVVVGSDAAEVVSLGMGTETTDATVNERPIVVGELAHYEVLLPAEGPDVLMYFEGENYSGAGCGRTGLLLDNVRLE